MKPVQIFSEYDFVCPEDENEPVEEQAVFTICNLTVEQDAFLDDTIQGDVGLKFGSNILHVLNMGLKKIKWTAKIKGKSVEMKFERDPKGMSYPGNATPWKSKHLQQIPLRIRRIVAAKIRSLGELEEAEVKNS